MPTAIRRDGKSSSLFMDWTRTVPELDSQRYGCAMLDIDIVWHRFKIDGKRGTDHIIFIEEKSHLADVRFSQRDTMKKVAALIPDSVQLVEFEPGNPKWIKFWGWHSLRHSGESLRNAAIVLWDERPISLHQLVSILRFNTNPNTLARMDPRPNHHHPEKTPCMF